MATAQPIVKPIEPDPSLTERAYVAIKDMITSMNLYAETGDPPLTTVGPCNTVPGP